MRSAIILLAAAASASAHWLKWTGDREPIWSPRETGFVGEDEQVGWTPKPTPAPGVQTDGDKILDLLLKRDTTTWENKQTCGWFSGQSSSPFVCATNSSCATNSDHIVACASGTYSPFFSVCLDRAAFLNGACNSIGALTGCCESSQFPACGTYIWTGSPARSMYRCFSSQTIISMLDVPQFVIDASLSSISSTRSTGSGALTSSVPTSNPSGNSGDGNGTGNGNNNNNNNSSSGSSTNVGAIVGGVVGGVAGIALIAGAIAFLIIRNKRNQRSNPTYNAVPANEHNVPPQPPASTPGMSYAGTPASYPSNPSTNPAYDPATGAYKPYDPNSTYPQGVVPGQQNMAPNTYYQGAYPAPPNAAAAAAMVPPQHTGSTTGHPGHMSMGPPPSELESSSAVPAGHTANPAEMAASPQRY